MPQTSGESLESVSPLELCMHMVQKAHGVQTGTHSLVTDATGCGLEIIESIPELTLDRSRSRAHLKEMCLGKIGMWPKEE